VAREFQIGGTNVRAPLRTSLQEDEQRRGEWRLNEPRRAHVVWQVSGFFLCPSSQIDETRDQPPQPRDELTSAARQG
jgi:hypothetical protein